MLALLDSILSVGFDPEDQGRRALAWWDERAYTPDGDGAFDIGGATAAALHRLRAGVPAVDAGGPADSDDQGNGSLMRILPVALVDPPDDDAELVRRAHLAGRVTHGAIRCQVACALYVLVARILLGRPGGEPDVALALATDRLLAVYAGDPASASVLRELLAHRSTIRKPGGGWVLDSFWSAWEAVAVVRLVPRNDRARASATATTPIPPPPSPVASPVSGGDWTESNGGVPAEWLDALRGKDVVEGILERLGQLGGSLQHRLASASHR